MAGSMNTAVYYPHVTPFTDDILRTALLLWDQIEFIIPWDGFRSDHRSPEAAQIVEMIGRNHVPTLAQKAEAHRKIEEFATGRLPPALYYRDERLLGEPLGEIWAGKLLHETWEMLRELRLASDVKGNVHHLEDSTGLALMSILADCCAGDTKARITDRDVAYAQLTDVLVEADEPSRQTPHHYETLVSISLSLVNAGALPIGALIDLRAREAKRSGDDLARLRRRYREGIEKQVKALSELDRVEDLAELQRVFEQDMADDLADLKDELRLAKWEALTNKDVYFTALVGGVVAGGGLGSLWTGATAAAVGALPAVGGILNTRFKYAKDRRAISKRRPVPALI